MAVVERLIVLFAIGLVVVSVGVALARRQQSDNYWLTYSAINENWEQNIYVTHVPSGKTRRVTFDPISEAQPVWSPDGEWILYKTYSRGMSEIYQVHWQDGQQHRYAQQVSAIPAQWNEHAIVYTTQSHFLRVNDRSISYVRTEGYTIYDDWIAVVTSRAPGFQLRRLSMDGVQQEVLYTADHPLQNPAYSPDGRKIAFITYDSLKVLDVATREVKSIFWSHFINSYAWSPDSKWIALSSYFDSSITQTDLFQVRADGTETTRLSTHRENERVEAWSPDSRWIAFSADYDPDDERTLLYRIPSGGGDVQSITTYGDLNFDAAWRSFNDRNMHWLALMLAGLGLLVMQRWL